MDSDIYQKCINHIASLNAQLNMVSNQKICADQRIAELYKENGKIIEKFEAERKSLIDQINTFHRLTSETKEIKMRYKSQFEEYTKLRQEMLEVLENKKELEYKLNECQQDNIQLTKTIADLKNQMEREIQSRSSDLEKERDSSLEWKKNLLKKYLDEQYRANGILLNAYLEQCNITLQVFTSMNTFFNVNLFPESNEWNKAVSDLKELQTSQKVEYKKLFELWQNESTNVDDLYLNKPRIPPRPALPLAESVHRVLRMYFMNMMPRIPNMPQPAPPQPVMRPPLYLMNQGYPFPRSRMPFTPPQPLMNLNFPIPPIPPPPNQVYSEPNKPPNPDSSSVVTEDEKLSHCGSKDDSVNSNDVSLNEVELEEKDKLSEASSLGGSTSSLSMKSDTIPTTPINGLQLRQPKFGTDRAIEELRDEFIGVPVLDLVECVADVRKMHNNSLSGVETVDVINEAKQILLKKQRPRVHFYNDKTGSLDRQEEISKSTETATKDKLIKDNSHPFALSLRKRNNSVSSTSSAGSTPVKIDNEPSKKSGKLAWGSIKPNDINWTKETIEAECIICMDPLDSTRNKKNVYTLKCQHSFHTECIRKWFVNSQSCPNCRVYATHDEDFPPLPS